MPRHEPATVRRATRISRLVGAIVGVVAGVFYGAYVVPLSEVSAGNRFGVVAAALLGSAAMGLVFGFLVAPLLSVEPYLWLERTLDTAPPAQLVAAAIALVVALLVGVLLTLLLGGLPGGVGYMVSLAVTAVLVYVFVGAAGRRRHDLLELIRGGARSGLVADVDEGETAVASPQGVLVDTSVLVDGRIVDVARTGFVPGPLLVPGFVLEELQRLADAGDPARRAKGRRGLDAVERLRQMPEVECQVIDIDFPATPEVDARLVRLARSRGAAVMTNDYLLNRVARVEGVRVLNLNELANALKPPVTGGETLQVTIVKEGKELDQGVGYLEDGTMVVVEGGRAYLGDEVAATVTSVLQTAAGRLIFAQVENRSRSSVSTRAPRRSPPRVAKS